MSPKVTPAEEPEMDVLVKIKLRFGGSFSSHCEPAEPDNSVTLKKFASSRLLKRAYLKFWVA